MKLKISISDKIDMLKFKNLAKEREKAIETSFVDKIKTDYQTNELVNIIHPLELEVVVSKITKETMDTKTFTLKGLEELPIFKAGQYIVLEVNIDGTIYKRAYSISSSPNNLKEYDITVKRVRNGLVSNYLLDELKEGTKLIIHGPFGEFTYEPLRDKLDILALVGGSGITGVMALARAINDNKEDCNLTIIYGDKSEKDLIFKNELDRLSKENDRINVKYVLSDEVNSIYDSGLISKDIIKSYEIGKYSYFVCGPIHFYHYLNDIFKELDIPNKYIRHDIYKKIDTSYHIEHVLTVLTNDTEIKIPCYEDESLIESLEKAGVEAPSKCLVGVCGFCRSKLVLGEVKTTNNFVRESDKDYNYIHPCVSYPLSDVTIRLCK